MAVNVYLVIFRQFNATDLQRLEKRYLLACYGLPFIPAFAFLFVNDASKGRMYGNATVRDAPPICQNSSTDPFLALVLDLC